jgi:glycosyltransferase involved in cell wall biosynthesis
VRLAFVSPLPPAPTGIADYAAELVALLAHAHAIEVFHAQAAVDSARLPKDVVAFPAAELLTRHRARPYDVTVYQMGNGRDHAFAYELLARVPGLLVLHDLVLFHSRAAAFLDSEPVRGWRANPASTSARNAARPALAAWRAELLYSYPTAGARLYEAQLGTVGELLPYAYPLIRLPVEASRAVAVHSAFVAEAVKAEVPRAAVVQVPMPASAVTVAPSAVRTLRERLGIAADEIVVGAFGLMTKEKRIGSLARAFVRAVSRDARLRLLLVGPVPSREALDAQLDALGARTRAIVTGRVPFEDLPLYIEAADLVAHLRYPTGRETSAALLRVLAQGRPTLVSDLLHQADLPMNAVRRIDLAAEDRDLPEAILELAAAPDERRRLSAAAAAHVRAMHGPERVRAAWERALAITREQPDPPVLDWPAHWLPHAPGGVLA